MIERHFPGFRNLVAYQELSTPATTESLTGHREGRPYGFPATPKRFTKSYLSARTPLPGLFMAGADAMSMGIMGAMMGGVIAASLNLGALGFPRIVAAARRP
jgi:phytoene dehydrogenase-like protein